MSVLDSALLRFIPVEGSRLTIPGAFAVAALLAASAVYWSLGSGDKERGFPKLPGIQLYHAWNFFQRRNDFIQSNFERNSGQNFSFHIVQHKVTVSSGEDARRVFYSDPSLCPVEGFKLFAGFGVSRNLHDAETNSDMAQFIRAFGKLSSRSRTKDTLPTLMQDLIAKTDKWSGDGTSGRIDSFTSIFDLVCVMTARVATCQDLANNDADLKKIGDSVWTLLTGASPTSLILPWFPCPAKLKMVMAGLKLVLILRKYVEARRHAEPTNDAIDVLIAEGETTQDIIKVLFIFVFAGIANTVTITSWLLVDLAVHKEWRDKCKKEIQDVLSRHLGDCDSFATVCDKLSAIPLEAWEDELPILDACTRESQRRSFNFSILRRNVRKDIDLGGKVIRRGDFLAYPISDTHLNPKLYPDPQKYNPSRWLQPDSVPKAAYPFLGWGAGRHPCPGMRLGKLEIKLIVVIFLLRYEYDLVDEDGKFPNPLPTPKVDHIESRPEGNCYFKFRKVME